MPFEAPQFGNMGRTVISPNVIQAPQEQNFWGGVLNAATGSLFEMLPQLLGMDPSMIQAEAVRDQQLMNRENNDRKIQRQDFQALKAGAISQQAYDAKWKGKGSPSNEWDLMTGQKSPAPAPASGQTNPGAAPVQEQAPPFSAIPPAQDKMSAPPPTSQQSVQPTAPPPISSKIPGMPAQPMQITPPTPAEVNARQSVNRPPLMDAAALMNPQTQTFAQQAIQQGGYKAILPVLQNTGPAPKDENDRPEIRYQPSQQGTPEEHKEAVARQYRLGAALSTINAMTGNGKVEPDDMRMMAATADEIWEADRAWRGSSGVSDPELDFLMMPMNQKTILDYQNKVVLGQGTPEEQQAALLQYNNLQRDFTGMGYSAGAWRMGMDLTTQKAAQYGENYYKVTAASVAMKEMELKERALTFIEEPESQIRQQGGRLQNELFEGTMDYQKEKIRVGVEMDKAQLQMAKMAPIFAQLETQLKMMGVKADLARNNVAIIQALAKGAGGSDGSGAGLADMLGKLTDLTDSLGKNAETGLLVATKYKGKIKYGSKGELLLDPTIPPDDAQQIRAYVGARDMLVQGMGAIAQQMGGTTMKNEMQAVLDEARKYALQNSDAMYELDKMQMRLDGIQYKSDGSVYLEPQAFQTPGGVPIDPQIKSGSIYYGQYLIQQNGGRIPSFNDAMNSSAGGITLRDFLISKGITSTEDQKFYYNKYMVGNAQVLPDGYRSREDAVVRAQRIAKDLVNKPTREPDQSPTRPSPLPTAAPRPKRTGTQASRRIEEDKLAQQDRERQRTVLAAKVPGRILSRPMGSEDPQDMKIALERGLVEDVYDISTPTNTEYGVQHQSIGYIVRGKDPVFRDKRSKKDWKFSYFKKEFFASKEDFDYYVQNYGEGDDLFVSNPGLLEAGRAFFP